MSDPKTARLAFDGALGEMYRIFLVNLALNILTLGVYSFWGKTRVRRYLCTHTGMLGDRFEYTGTGGELFRGFLFAVFGLFLPAALIVLGLGLAFGPVAELIGQAAIGFLFFLLLPVAQFLGARYRLSRTQWRGVRFGLDGSPWLYGVKAQVQRLVVVASLGLLTPQATLALERYRLDRLMFGDFRGRLNAHWREAPWLSWLLPLIIIYVLLGVFVAYVAFAALSSGQVEASPEAQSLMLALMLNFGAYLQYVVIALIAFSLLAPFLFVWHQARFVRFLCTRWGLRGDAKDDWVALYPPQSPGAYVRLFVLNYLIIILTLGLGAPIVWRRTMRFLTRFVIVNADAVEHAAQSALTKPRRGEGLMEALDVGAI